MSTAEPLQLDTAPAPRLVGSRVRYPAPLAHYADLYSHDERTIKRWVSTGLYEDAEKTRRRDPLDLPPLHRPADMPAWWERRMRSRCPASILSAASTAGHVIIAQAKASASEPAAPITGDPIIRETPPAHLPPPVDTYPGLIGLEYPEQVASLRLERAIVQQRLDRAREGQIHEGRRVIDENACEAIQRQLLAVGDNLRKAENDLTKYLQDRGDLVPRDDVRTANNRLASTIFQNVRALVRKVRPQLAGKTVPEQDRIWETSVLACFDGLRESPFADPLSA